MLFPDRFEEFLEYLRIKGKSDSLIATRRRHLFDSLGKSKLSSMHIADMKLTDVAYALDAGRKHGKWGESMTITTLRMYLKYLKESGIDLPFDWRDVEQPSFPHSDQQILELEEYFRLCNAIDTSTIVGLRQRALIETLFSTGMRISEAMMLKRSQVDTHSREARIVSEKTKQYRTIYFNDRSIKWLTTYFQERSDYLEWAFVNRPGTAQLRRDTARMWLLNNRDCLQVNKRLHYHMFRRSFVTHLLRRGVEIKAVQKMAGHLSPRTTLRHYAIATDSVTKSEFMKAMNNLDVSIDQSSVN